MDLPTLLAAIADLDADSLAQVRQVADGRAAVLAAGCATVDYGTSCERCGVRDVERAGLCRFCLAHLAPPEGR